MIDAILPLGGEDLEFLEEDWVECWRCYGSGSCFELDTEEDVVCGVRGGVGGRHHVEPEDETDGPA